MDSLKELYLAAGAVNTEGGGVELPDGGLGQFDIKLTVIPHSVIYNSVLRNSEVVFRVPISQNLAGGVLYGIEDTELILPLRDIHLLK